MSDPTADLKTIATQFAELCRTGAFDQAITELHAEDAVTAEACDFPEASGMKRVIEGLPAIKAFSEWWSAHHEVHHMSVNGPFFHLPDRFCLYMTIDVTPKVGPMAGNRHTMEEVCLYTVKDGKVSRAEFFYGL